MRNPFVFLFGYVMLSVPREYAHMVVNILGSTVYRNFDFTEDRAVFEVSAIGFLKARRLLLSHGLSVELESFRGVPALLWRYRKRYGVFVGILLFFAITVVSSLFIWDVRVVGNIESEEEDIVAELSECGFGIGSFIPRVDTLYLENLFLLQSDSAVWASINIRGTVAEVEIIEKRPEPEEDGFLYCDLVASSDGVIALFESTRGNALVEIGDEVKAGDVLISGYYPAEENVGERYTEARGKVFARTKRDISLSVPLEYEKKVYTGRKKCEKYFIFFKNEVKFFSNSRNLYANCDTIDTVEYYELSGGVLLPFGVRTVEYIEYENEKAVRSPESALELALYTLGYKLNEGEDCTLLKKDIAFEYTDTECRIRCLAEFYENIAVKKEILNGDENSKA